MTFNATERFQSQIPLLLNNGDGAVLLRQFFETCTSGAMGRDRINLISAKTTR